MNKLSELSLPIKLIMLAGAIHLIYLVQINRLFWYMQIMYHPIVIFSAELFASVLLAIAMFAGLKVKLKISPFQKKWLLSLVIGLVAIIALYFLSKWTGFYFYSEADSSVWRPYFIMETFLFMPLLQELTFRELFLKLFPTKLAWMYILGSSLAVLTFSFIFLGSYDIKLLIFLFFSGLVFSGLRWYSKDIKLPIVLHILLNLGAYFL
ncbi:MAG: hypothetical protein LBV19_08285 [Streptococcaceae bacterium]|nr:hypothetical protein [Streptococcaceae bacterium]